MHEKLDRKFTDLNDAHEAHVEEEAQQAAHLRHKVDKSEEGDLVELIVAKVLVEDVHASNALLQLLQRPF